MSSLDDIERTGSELYSYFEKKDQARESANKLCREIIRNCSQGIRNIHVKDSNDIIKETKALVKKLNKVCLPYPDLFEGGMVTNALQEYVEVSVLKAILLGRKAPTTKSLGVTPSAYMLGLGDVIGELRREALICMRNDDLDTAYKRLDEMEALYSILMQFHFPSAVLNIRHKQDVARSLIEKTRGELVIAGSALGLKK